MAESLYSTSEVARLFEINRVTIYRWVQEGVVKAYKVGKHLKIPASEVERLWKEFGFPEGPNMHVADLSQKDGMHESVNSRVKYEQQKKLVMAVDSDEQNIKFIREIFASAKLKGECVLETYTDNLEAALAIGKEKPDLLLIKMMKSDGGGEEFARKIRGLHSDIKIIFMGDTSTNRNRRGGAAFPDDAVVNAGRVGLYQEITRALGLYDKR
ncbi:MAG: helix-turn-helix domain-containing protein [Syntrophales bacterium]|jgi:excisionase family DNA binding protein